MAKRSGRVGSGLVNRVYGSNGSLVNRVGSGRVDPYFSNKKKIYIYIYFFFQLQKD